MKAREVLGRTVAFMAAGAAAGVGFGIGVHWVGGGNGASPAFAQTGQPAATRGQDESNIIRVARSVSPAVVLIQDAKGLGTGIIYDSTNGLILTNAHVVNGAENGRVIVRLKNAQEYPGKVLGADPGFDIAVVKVNAKNLPAAQLGDSDKIEVGQTTIAIGNPLGLEQTVTTGIVSAVNRKIRKGDAEGFIQTDAAINPGNSGGPLVDSMGRVIGINTAVLRMDGAEGLGLAVPINVARDEARKLITGQSVKRVTMGLTIGTISPQLAQKYGLPVQQGVIIGDVVAGLGAAEAGLKKADIIIKMDDRPVINNLDVSRLLRGKQPGESVVVTILRSGAAGPQNVTVRLAEAPRQ